MSKLYLFLLISIISRSISAQCTGGTSGGAVTPAPTTAYQTMNLPAGDFYYTFVVSACLNTMIFRYAWQMAEPLVLIVKFQF